MGQDAEHSLLAAVAPRRAVRKRIGDVFLAMITLEGNALLSAMQQQALLEKAAEVYFSSNGSVTAGLRAAVGPLNEFLYGYNLRGAREGAVCTGLLNMAVLHGDLLLIAHAGCTHTLSLTGKQVQDFVDEQGGRGLGVARNPSLRFYQTEVSGGDVLIFSARPPESWNAALLAGAPQLNRDALRRRLLHQVGDELQAAVFQFQVGSGKLHFLRPRPLGVTSLPTVSPPSAVEEPKPVHVDVQSSAASAPQGGTDALPIRRRRAEKPGPLYLTGERLDQPSTAENLGEEGETRSAPVEQPQRSKQHSDRQQHRGQRNRTVQELALVWKRLRSALGRLQQKLPRFPLHLPPLSPTAMLALALLVPFIFVSIGATVYIRNGEMAQHQALVYIAQQKTDRAEQVTGVAQQRAAWRDVLAQLDEADHYGRSEQATYLRSVAQQKLDELDSIRRINYQPALAGGFDSRVTITQLVSSFSGDLYALDSVQGQVLRLKATSTGYSLDRQFICGPGPIGPLIIGPLVDLVPLPRKNPYNAEVMAIDGGGALIFCTPGKGPDAIPLTLDREWGKITAITFYQDSLFVLDPASNVVWRFDELQQGFTSLPRSLEVNVTDMFNVIDLAIYADDLFLLHEDGRTTRCTYRSDFSPVMDCQEPSPYWLTDVDGVKQPLDVISGTKFIQAQTTYPLEPSLFLLDQAGRSLYRFSMALQMQYQIRPSQAAFGLSQPIRDLTAFCVTPLQDVVLAFGDQIYSAPLPAP
jgi:hypothetical protein